MPTHDISAILSLAMSYTKLLNNRNDDLMRYDFHDLLNPGRGLKNPTTSQPQHDISPILPPRMTFTELLNNTNDDIMSNEFHDLWNIGGGLRNPCLPLIMSPNPHP